MKFSVLMSVYKNDNLIHFREALESVTINQNLKPNQVVLVYDGPVSKEIDEIIEKVKQQDRTIEYKIIKKNLNTGLANSLNIGLKNCKYDWVARMDADDISVKERFEKQFLFLKKNPQISVLGAYIAEFEENVNQISTVRKVKLNNNEILKVIKFRCPMNHMSVVYKKNIVMNIGGYNENFGKLEDYKLWIDLIEKGEKFANIDDILVNVRIGNGFIERRSDKREIKDWDMLQKYLLSIGLINQIEALRNRVCIRVFIYMPGWIKKILYKKVLRG